MKYSRTKQEVSILLFLILPVSFLYATPAAPVADISITPDPATVGQSIIFDGTASHDNIDNGNIVKYQWTFPQEAVFVYGVNSSKAMCKFPQSGTYSISLKVWDDLGLFNEVSESVEVTGLNYTWYVSTTGSDIMNDGQSEINAFRTIQTGIDCADDGDTVIVSYGIYYENLSFKGKDITVKSTDPSEWFKVKTTIVRPVIPGDIVTFTGSESEQCKLEGITIEQTCEYGDLMIHYDFEKTSSAFVINSEGVYHGAFINGDPAIVTGNDARVETYSMQFDGIDDYLQVENCKGIYHNKARTCSAWIKTDSSGRLPIVYWGSSTGDGRKWQLEVDQTSGVLRVDTGNGYIKGSTPVNNNQWVHVAAVLPDRKSSTSDILLYVDGQLETNTSTDYGIVCTSIIDNILIGKASTDYFDGTMDDVRIYNRALSGHEISMMAYKNGPVANMEFDFNLADDINQRIGQASDDPIYNFDSKSGICSYEFNGQNYIDIDGYKGINGTASRTVSAWIYIDPDSTDETRTIAEWGSADSGGIMWLFTARYLTDRYVANVFVGGGGINGNTEIIPGQWTHIAAVLEDDGSPNADEIKLYVNGRPDPIFGSTSQSISTGSVYDVRIGHRVDYDPGNQIEWPFIGKIDDFRIYNRALSDAEVASLVVSPDYIPSPDASWEFDSSLNDGSVNDYHLSPSTGMNPAVYKDNFSTRALFFDGTDDYAIADGAVESSESFKGITGDNDRTCSAWIRTTDVSGGIISWGTVSSANWDISLDSLGYLHVDAGTGTAAADSIVLTDGRWHHIAVTLADEDYSETIEIKDIRIYIDGILQDLSVTNESNAVSTGDTNFLAIGALHAASPAFTNYFTGQIDKVAVYSSALSYSQVNKLSQDRPEGLEAYWKFDEVVSDETEDEITGYTGDIEGAAFDAEGMLNGALEFDGTDDYVDITDYKGITGTASRTVSAWIYINEKATPDMFELITEWGCITETVTDGDFWIFTARYMTDKYVANVMVGGGGVIGDLEIPRNQWVHVTAVLEDNGSTTSTDDIKLYVNGIFDSKAAYNTEEINTVPDSIVRIGSRPSGDWYFDGMIDDFRIYNTALSQEEISDIYSGSCGIKGNGTSANISRCIIKDNVTGLRGGGIWNVDGLISNCVIYNNEADITGGGLADCDGRIQYCVVSANTSLGSGGFDNCQAEILNCTVISNTGIDAGGMYNCAAETGNYIKNSIFWENNSSYDLAACGNISHCSVEYDSNISGIGIITGDPLLQLHPDISMMSRLGYRSACIDSGDNQLNTGETINDIDGDNIDEYTYIDIGSDEFVPGIIFFDSDSYNNIQTVIDDANDGDIIILPEGIYSGTGNHDLDFCGKAIELRSTSPDDKGVIARTIIDCKGSESDPARAFLFHSGEDNSSVINGLTIINGYQAGSNGGGINCSNGSSPTIRNCIIKNCTAQNGGGIFCDQSSPFIIGSAITNNSANQSSNAEGGGIYCLDGSNPVIRKSIISQNSSGAKGGGISCMVNSSPNFENCRILANTAETAGGIYINQGSSPDITNTVFIGNEASGTIGGGAIAVAYDSSTSPSSPALKNCSIISNKATGTNAKGGGVYVNNTSDSIDFHNCILWDNHDLYISTDPGDDNIELDQIYDGFDCAVAVSYSCIQDEEIDEDHYAGANNIDDNPSFLLDPSDGGDGWFDDDATEINESANNIYGLVEFNFGSQCIDAGNNSIVSTSEDLNGELRIVDGDEIEGAVVDIGAYEYNEEFYLSAGSNQVVALPNHLEFIEVSLNGRFTYPTSGDTVYSCIWSMATAAPSECMTQYAFTDTASAASSIRLYKTGKYIVRLSAVNPSGVIIKSSEAMITVNAHRFNNLPSVYIVPPVANDENDDGSWNLHGIVTDDGLPGNFLDIKWSAAATPQDGAAFFDNYDQADTTVSFHGSNGTYVLKLSATDGQLDDSGELIYVDAYVTITGSAVSSPVFEIYAGADKTNVIPDSDPAVYSDEVELSDAAVISGIPVSYEWSAVSTPSGGNVTFDDNEILKPTAAFSKSGLYELKLYASDGSLEDESYVTIHIINPLEADAGSYGPVTIPGNLQLSGNENGPNAWYDKISVNDLDETTYPKLSDIEYQWSMSSGDGTVEFVPGVEEGQELNTSISGILNPEVFFSRIGSYTLKLTVTLKNGDDPDLTASDLVTIKVVPGKKFIEAGIVNTYVIMEDSKVWACGASLDDSILPGLSNPENMLVPAWTDAGESNQLQNIIYIDSGATQTLAVDYKNMAFSWGTGYSGQLGNHTSNNRPYPQNMYEKDKIEGQYVNLGNIIDVAASKIGQATANAYDYSIVSDKNLNLWSCGTDGLGKLGRYANNTINPVIGQVVAGDQAYSQDYLENIIEISTGDSFTLALENLDSDPDCLGRVYAFGQNGRGTLGNAGAVPSPIYNPQLVLAGDQDPDFDPVTNKTHLENIVAVSAGFDHAMALEICDSESLTLNGHVYTWGLYGSLVGSRIYIWDSGTNEGYRQAGRLGIGDFGTSVPDTTCPRKVIREDGKDLTDIVSISAGGDHCLALDKNGYVWSWGDNTIGQLGTGTAGTTANKFSAAQVMMIDIDGSEKRFGEHCDGGIVSISAGAAHSLAVDAEGVLWAWGSNKYGQLGIGGNCGDDDNYVVYPVRMVIKGQNKVINLNTEEEFAAINQAIQDTDTLDSHTILVYPGEYPEIVTIDKDITLTSLDPDDPEIVASTIINGVGGGSNVESGGLVNISKGTLTGFSIINYAKGIYLENAVGAVIEKNMIFNNKSVGIMCINSEVHISNNYIYRNAQDPQYVSSDTFQSGIGLFYNLANPYVVNILNNTIIDNYGHGIYVSGSSADPQIYNCIIWGNDLGQLTGYTASYSCIQDCQETDGNINLDPQLTAGTYRYRIQEDSPCIDAGSNTGISATDTDIEGNPRIIDGTDNDTADAAVDIGAYEYPIRTIYAGRDKSITITDTNNSIKLSDASVIFFGRNVPTTQPTYSWSLFRGPNDSASVSFNSSGYLNPAVTFTEYGTYIIQLDVYENSQWLGSDKVKITVNAGINAGSDASFALGSDSSNNYTDISGTVYLNSTSQWTSGLPDGYSVKWTCPETGITINDYTNISTVSASFVSCGVFPITLTLYDPQEREIGSDTLLVTVYHPVIHVNAAVSDNQPYMSAVEKRSAEIDLYGTIAGTVPDRVLWKVVQGPGEVVFSNEYDCLTTAEFTEPGDYIIALLAQETASNDEYRTIGADITDTISVAYCDTDISISSRPEKDPDDGIIKIASGGKKVVNLFTEIEGADKDNLSWEIISQPSGSEVYLGGTTAERTWISFDTEGSYIAALIIKNENQDIVVVEPVQIRIGSTTQLLTVDAGNDLDIDQAEVTTTVYLQENAVDTGQSISWLCSDILVTVDETGGSYSADIERAGKYQFTVLLLDDQENIIAVDKMNTTINPWDTTVISVFDNDTNRKSIELIPGRRHELFASLHGTYLPGITAAWSEPGDPDYSEIFNSSGWNARIGFTRAGLYPILLEGTSDSIEVDRDACLMTVTYPQVFVDAWITDTNGEFECRKKAVTTNTITLDGSIILGDTNLTGTDYFEWIVLSKPSGISDNHDFGIDNTGISESVNLPDNPAIPGRYVFALVGKLDGQNLGMSAVEVYVASSATDILYAGQDKAAIMRDGSASVKFTDAISTSGGTPGWTSHPDNPGTPSFDNSAVLDPTVTFYYPGEYMLTLTCGTETDDVLVNVYPEEEFLVVSAGSYKDISLPETLHLTNAWDICIYDQAKRTSLLLPGNSEESVIYEKSYRWTVLNADRDDVSFYPTPNCLNPVVSFAGPGSYVLQLSVTIGKTNGITRTSQAVINVFDEDTDTTAPVSITLTTDPADLSSLPANGQFTVTVNAADNPGGQLREIRLLLNDNTIKTFSAKPGYPESMSVQYTINTYELALGDYDLTATAVDLNNNSTTTDPPVEFTTSGWINSFKVNPSEVYSYNDEISVSAEFTSAASRSLNVKYGEISVYSDTFNGTTLETDFIPEEDFENIPLGYTLSPGTYKIEITEGSAAAQLVFEIFDGTDEGSLNAHIANADLKSGKIDQIFPGYDPSSTMLPVISTGIYNLLGTAKYTGFDNVKYKVELYDGDINLKNTHPQYWTGYNAYRIKNMTPGYLEEGYSCSTVENSLLGKLDFTDVPNGVYQLLLTVRCGDMYAYDTVRFILDCQLKIGNVKFSQEDISIPVGGIPIRIIRSYDSFRRKKDSDFGYGWTFSIASMDIELDERRDNMGDFTRRNGGEINRDVTLTLPDGRRTTFKAVYKSYESNKWTLEYESSPGVNATLKTSREFILRYGGGLGGVNHYWIVDGEEYINSFLQELPINLSYHDIPGWILEDNGTKYHIMRENNQKHPIDDENIGSPAYEAYGKPYLKKIVTPSGEKLEFNIINDELGENPAVSGIEYFMPDINTDQDGHEVISYDEKAVKAVKITRNDKGRVEAIYAPGELEDSGELKKSAIAHIKYKYDDEGNLTQVLKLTNRDGINEDEMYDITTYSYGQELSRFGSEDHYLTKIIDERGIAPVQYVYDEKGRLIGTKDARGNTVELEHNIDERTETITDRNGNVTIYSYNNTGNVTSATKIIDSKPYTTSYKYPNRESEYQDKPTEIKTPLDISRDGSIQYSITTSRYWKDNYLKYEETTDPVGGRTVNCFDADRKPLYSKHNDGKNTSAFYNTYDNFDRLKTSRNEKNGRIQEFTVYIYDNKGRISNIVDVDPEYVSDFSGLYELNSIDELSGDGYLITDYYYNSISNSEDQPYSISEPYCPGENPAFTLFVHYNDSGNQDVTAYRWQNPADGDTDVDAVVINGTFFDDQGREIKTVRQILDADGNIVSTVTLSKTTYNSIGIVDTTVDQNGILTKYFYNETGNMAEMLIYESESQYNDNINSYLADNTTTGILSIVQNLYDNNERILVTVGPYDPSDTTTPNYPQGAETVYDKQGRIAEVRKWAAVSIDFDNILDLDDNIVGKKITVQPQNAWDGTGNEPADIGWKSNGKLPVVKSGINANQAGPMSYTQKKYDFAGRVKHSVVLDENACQQVTSYKHDSTGRQTAVIDPLGHFPDNQSNNLYEIGILLNDGITNVTKINFDQLKFTVYHEIDNPGGNLTGTHITETHYTRNKCDYVIDPAGNMTRYTYNHLGQLVTTEHPKIRFDENTETRNIYSHTVLDSHGRKKFETGSIAIPYASSVEASEFKQYEYDSLGRLAKVIMPLVDDPQDDPDLGPVHPTYRYLYDRYGNLICIMDPLNRATVFEYDYMHRLTKKYKPFRPLDLQDQPMDIDTISDVYEAIDIALEWQTPPCFETKQYDELGRLACEIDYKGTKITYAYYSVNDSGNRPGLLKTTRYYENTGTPANPAWNSSPAEELTYIYDKLGRQKQIIDSTDPGNEIILQDYKYDAEDRVVSLISPQGTVNYEFSSITGQKTATWTGNPGSEITRTEFSYDQQGRLKDTQLTQRDGSSLTAPETTSCTYNVNGSRDTLTLPNGIITQYSYNAMNHLANVINSFTDQQATTVLSSFIYSHHADGMRSGVNETFSSQEGHDITYEYDNLNRIIYESNYNTNTNPDGYRSKYVYDLAGNRLERQVEVTNTNGTNTETITVDYYYNGPPDQLTKEVYSNRAFTAFLWNDKHVYAYATPGASLRYRISGSSEYIGQIRAFFIGMPSALSRYLYFIAVALLPATFFGPLLIKYYQLIRNTRPNRTNPRIYTHSLCLLLAYTFLVGPCINELSADELEYTNLSAASWGQNGDSISYWYDANGSMCYKIFTDVTGIETKTRAEIETYLSNNPSVNYDRFTYNLQNRVSQLDKKRTGTLEQIEYIYNPQGIRVEKVVDSVSTIYLTDPFNHTGFSQVLEEWSAGQTTPDITYTIGDDVITQADASGVKHLLYDGHGSTRQLANQSSQVTENYNYDAYGILLQENPAQAGSAPQQDTNLLYAGEYFDTSAQHYFNRTRWYNPYNGRFNRADDHPGSLQDPQSLHKYLYCHDNPTNAIDPTGQFLILNLMGRLAQIGTLIIKYYPLIKAGLIISDILTVVNIILKALTEGISSITAWEWTELALITTSAFFGGKIARRIAKGLLRRVMRIPAGALKSFNKFASFIKSKGFEVLNFPNWIKLTSDGKKAVGGFRIMEVSGIQRPVILLYKGGQQVYVLMHEFVHAIQWKKYYGIVSSTGWTDFRYDNNLDWALEEISRFVTYVFIK